MDLNLCHLPQAPTPRKNKTIILFSQSRWHCLGDVLFCSLGPTIYINMIFVLLVSGKCFSLKVGKKTYIIKALHIKKTEKQIFSLGIFFCFFGTFVEISSMNKIYRIRETLNLSTCADSSTTTIKSCVRCQVLGVRYQVSGVQCVV